MHSALRKLKALCERDGVRMVDASLRRAAYHSALEERADIVFGATKPEQIEAIATTVAMEICHRSFPLTLIAFGIIIKQTVCP